jgi:hypothetical protein
MVAEVAVMESDGVGWEVEQIRGMDGEEMMSVVVELRTEVSVEDICYEGTISAVVFLLGLGTGFSYYGMSTLQDHSLCTFTKGMRGWEL